MYWSTTLSNPIEVLVLVFVEIMWQIQNRRWILTFQPFRYLFGFPISDIHVCHDAELVERNMEVNNGFLAFKILIQF